MQTRKIVLTENNPYYDFAMFDLVNGAITQSIKFGYCRAWAADSLMSIKTKNGYKYSSYQLNENYNYKTGDTYVVYKTDVKETTILKNLAELHKLEDIAKVKRTRVYKTQCLGYYLFIGSGHWKRKCWSQLLYTFFIKNIVQGWGTTNSSYWLPLSKYNNLNVLLSKVKTRTEIFSTKVFGKNLTINVHKCEGFVSICEGMNPPMGKFLGITPTEYTPEKFYNDYGWTIK